jgi:hypothetical protein
LWVKLANLTHSSNNNHQRDTRRKTEIFSKLHANVEMVLEEADVDGSLDDVVFIETRFWLVTNSSCLCGCSLSVQKVINNSCNLPCIETYNLNKATVVSSDGVVGWNLKAIHGGN